MFLLQCAPIDVSAVQTSLRDPGCGGYASFEGWVRDHHQGRAVLRLAYEAYPALAQREGERILEEARQQFDIVAARCLHRVGELEIGDLAVWVGVSAAHRKAAFEACRFVIDEVKRRVPIWKKEHYADGTSEWVNCAACGEPPRRQQGQVRI